MTIRSLLTYVGIDLRGKKIMVGDREVDPEAGEREPEPELGDRFREITNRFTYHPPTDQQVFIYKRIGTQANSFAFTIEEFCPDSEEKKIALLRLDEVVMHVNAAIARHS